MTTSCLVAISSDLYCLMTTGHRSTLGHQHGQSGLLIAGSFYWQWCPILARTLYSYQQQQGFPEGEHIVLSNIKTKYFEMIISSEGNRLTKKETQNIRTSVKVISILRVYLKSEIIIKYLDCIHPGTNRFI